MITGLTMGSSHTVFARLKLTSRNYVLLRFNVFDSQVRQGLSVGGVNNKCSLHLQYHDWGETLEQGTDPPTAPRAPQHGCPLLRVCVHCCVCVHLDGLNAEDKFRVWVTILGHTPLPFNVDMIKYSAAWKFVNPLQNLWKCNFNKKSAHTKCMSFFI